MDVDDFLWKFRTLGSRRIKSLHRAFEARCKLLILIYSKMQFCVSHFSESLWLTLILHYGLHCRLFTVHNYIYSKVYENHEYIIENCTRTE